MSKFDPVLNQYKDIEIVEAGPVNDLDFKSQLIVDILRAIVVIIASAIYSLAVVWFLEPAKLVSLGLTAVGQILNRLFDMGNINIPVGVFVLILNIPLIIIGIKFVSKRFVVFTFISVLTQSILLMGWIDVPHFLKALTENAKSGTDFNEYTLYLSILAGLLGGAGIGIGFRAGGSLGGIDVLAQALKLKKNINISVFSVSINVVLAVIAGGIMEGDWAITLCTIIFIILSYIVVDKIHTGYNTIRIDIVTKKCDEMTEALIMGIGRGCSVLEVKGAYTNENKYDIFMVISSYELDKARRIISNVDKEAWVTIIPVKRVIGSFFRHTIS